MHTEFKPATLMLHGARPVIRAGEPVSQSIVAATSFYADPGAVGFSANDIEGTPPPFYTRWGNPTVGLLEARLSAIEGGAGAVAFASGMAAVAALFHSVLSAGDHLVLSNVCYAGVAELALDILPRFGIETTMVDESDPAAVAGAIRPGVTKLVHLETPANPILRLADIAAISAITRAAGVALSVDSTIATPIATRPLGLGADFVVHSLTKYICGHGDALGGIVVAADSVRVAALRTGPLIHHGAALSPFAAWLILRGLETLPARMRLHAANARVVADALALHPAVDRVLWPGAADHPQADLARRQMETPSGLLSFTVKGDGKAIASRLAHALQVVSYAVSLGKTKSLLFYIPTEDLLRSSLRGGPAAEAAYREVAGDGVFRLSVGLEDPLDIVGDIAAGL